MEHFNLIVIGGDAAGMSAASQARRKNKDMSIAVFDKGEFVSYAACGTPYLLAGDVQNHQELIAIDVDEFINKRKIIIKRHSEVTAVYFDEKKITVNSQNNVSEYTYDKLVIATGALPFIPPITGVHNPRTFVLRNLTDALKIKDFMDTEKPERALLVGGGLINLELSEAFTRNNIKTTIIEKMHSVASNMSPEIQKIITEKLTEHGVTVIPDAEITEIIYKNDSVKVTGSMGEIETDFIVISIGVRPNTAFLKDSILEFHKSGAIIIDEKSRTNLPHVYAAGDCATVKNLITGQTDYIPIATTANKQGRVAGLQASGVESEIFKGAIGSLMVKIFDLQAAKTGFNSSEAEKHGIKTIEQVMEWHSRPGYCPESAPIVTKLTVDEKTRKIIGGEIAGTDGAALRINTVATAITAGMTIEDLAYLDLGYAPPFSPVWDTVAATAQLFIKR